MRGGSSPSPNPDPILILSVTLPNSSLTFPLPGTFTQPFFGADPDDRRIETPPQAMGVVFNTEGRVSKLNVGAVMDRTSGNTGGLGGLFAFLWFVGKSPPAPEYQPYKPSWQFELIRKIGSLVNKPR